MRPKGPVAITILLASLATPQFSGAANAPVDAIDMAAAGLAGFDTAAGGDIQRSQSKKPSGPAKNFVSTIQEELANQGFYLGPIDGRMGPQTEAAIRAYQQSRGLPVTGTPSQALLQSLR